MIALTTSWAKTKNLIRKLQNGTALEISARFPQSVFLPARVKRMPFEGIQLGNFGSTVREPFDVGPESVTPGDGDRAAGVR